MAADLHIHAYKDDEITEEDFQCFFGNHLGSKYFDLGYECQEEHEREVFYNEQHERLMREFPSAVPDTKEKQDRWYELCDEVCEKFPSACSHHTKISNTSNIWIGEVSWLKAALLEDAETFIPNAIGEIAELIGEDNPEIDDHLIQSIINALNSPNSTSYSLANVNDVKEWLEQYKGYKCFTVSW